MNCFDQTFVYICHFLIVSLGQNFRSAIAVSERMCYLGFWYMLPNFLLNSVWIYTPIKNALGCVCFDLFVKNFIEV